MQIKMLQDRVKELEDALDMSITQIEKYQLENKNLINQKKSQENAFLKVATEVYVLKRTLSSKDLKKVTEENIILKKELSELKKTANKEAPRTSAETPILDNSKEKNNRISCLEKEIYLLKEEISILKDEIIRTRRVTKKLDSYTPEEVKPTNRGLNGVHVKGY